MSSLVVGAMWRQGSDLTVEQQTVAGLVASLQSGGFTVAIADVYQGTQPQGAFSQTAVDFPDVSAVVALATALAGAGIRFWPMVNPFGDDPVGEATLHAAAAHVVATAIGEPVPLVVDFEYWYAGFF